MGKYVVTQTFKGIEEGEIFPAGATVEFSEVRAEAINKAISGGALKPLRDTSAEKAAAEKAEAERAEAEKVEAEKVEAEKAAEEKAAAEQAAAEKAKK